MEEREAIHFLCDHCVFRPRLNAAQARAIWFGYHRRTIEICASPQQPQAPGAVPLDGAAPPAAQFLAAIGATTDVTGVVAAGPRGLLAYQFGVTVDRAHEHGALRSTWAERCLVVDRPRSSLVIKRDGDSLFFDVPHAEHLLTLSPEGALSIDQVPGYVMVVPFGSGLVLKAGYHRAYAYLSARPGPREPFVAAMTKIVPGEILDAPLRGQLEADRPPLVGDFLNPALALAVRTHRQRYRFKITATMQALPWSAE
ncbi:MAG TPA: hypothetical protein VN690_06175 [Terriglobales bacterium]|nr:hypothetical protein [Terriglobales bacterium]